MNTPEGWVRLTRPDFSTDPVSLAQGLIGCRLVRVSPGGRRVSGVIVETEAYLGVRDAAAHSHRGRRTARTEPMYAIPGTAYVYFTYGMHHCFNVVCGEEGEPVAVLVRALRPDEGVAVMRCRRWGGDGAGESDTLLCAGPGRLCQALGIDRRLSGVDLVSHPGVFLERRSAAGTRARGTLRNSARIGVGRAGAWAARRLRWYLAGDPHVSGVRRSGERHS